MAREGGGGRREKTAVWGGGGGGRLFCARAGGPPPLASGSRRDPLAAATPAQVRAGDIYIDTGHMSGKEAQCRSPPDIKGISARASALKHPPPPSFAPPFPSPHCPRYEHAWPTPTQPCRQIESMKGLRHLYDDCSGKVLQVSEGNKELSSEHIGAFNSNCRGRWHLAYYGAAGPRPLRKRCTALVSYAQSDFSSSGETVARTALPPPSPASNASNAAPLSAHPSQKLTH
ncbi:unnamed protein product, partial [Iphiclides podalirius]